jgi:hypothetical protein
VHDCRQFVHAICKKATVDLKHIEAQADMFQHTLSELSAFDAQLRELYEYPVPPSLFYACEGGVLDLLSDSLLSQTAIHVEEEGLLALIALVAESISDHRRNQCNHAKQAMLGSSSFK